MQVMLFWVKFVGRPTNNLFHLGYGGRILRHYLDMEHGNLFLSLDSYNDSRGLAACMNVIQASWLQWRRISSSYQVAMK